MRFIDLTKRLVLFFIIFLFPLSSSFLFAEKRENNTTLYSHKTEIQRNTLYRESWAVIVGINTYKNWPALTYAVNNAEEIKLIFEKAGFQTKIFIDEDATKANILGYLLNDLQKKAQKEDRIVFFFSGHGQTTTFRSGMKKGYIIPTEGIYDLPTSNISPDELKSIAELIKAKHTFFVLDTCCSSSQMTIDSETKNNQPDTTVSAQNYIINATQKKACYILTAGGENQQIVTVDGKDLFTLEFINGMNGAADSNKDNYITGNEIAHYVTTRVAEKSKNSQIPFFGQLCMESGDIVFELANIVERGYSEVAREIKQETNIDNVNLLYSNFTSKYPNESKYADSLERSRYWRIKEIQERNNLIELIRKIDEIHQIDMAKISFELFIKEFPESNFLKEIESEMTSLSEKIMHFNNIKTKINETQCYKELAILGEDLLRFKQTYPECGANYNSLKRIFDKNADKLEDDLQKNKKKVIKKISLSKTPSEVEAIKIKFISNKCQEELWFREIEELATGKIRDMELNEKKAYEIAKSALETATDAADAHLIYEDFKVKYPYSTYSKTLYDFTVLKNAELKLSSAKTKEEVNTIFSEYILTLEREEHKKSLMDLVSAANDKIEQMMTADIHTRINDATNLCEITAIENEINRLLQLNPESKPIRELISRKEQKYNELRREALNAFAITRQQISKEWNINEINKKTAIFHEKYPCNDHSGELNAFLRSRIIEGEKVTKQYESILLEINEADSSTQLEEIMGKLDAFANINQNTPFVSQLTALFQKKYHALTSDNKEVGNSENTLADHFPETLPEERKTGKAASAITPFAESEKDTADPQNKLFYENTSEVINLCDNLCELNDIENTIRENEQNDPENAYIAMLNSQISNHREGLEKQIQLTMEIIKLKIDKEWDEKNILQIVSQFTEKNPCSKYPASLKVFSEYKIKTIQKIRTNYESIQNELEGAADETVLSSLKNVIDLFSKNYEQSPFAKNLQEQLQKKYLILQGKNNGKASQVVQNTKAAVKDDTLEEIVNNLNKAIIAKDINALRRFYDKNTEDFYTEEIATMEEFIKNIEILKSSFEEIDVNHNGNIGKVHFLWNLDFKFNPYYTEMLNNKSRISMTLRYRDNNWMIVDTSEGSTY